MIAQIPGVLALRTDPTGAPASPVPPEDEGRSFARTMDDKATSEGIRRPAAHKPRKQANEPADPAPDSLPDSAAPAAAPIARDAAPEPGKAGASPVSTGDATGEPHHRPPEARATFVPGALDPAASANTAPAQPSAPPIPPPDGPGTGVAAAAEAVPSGPAPGQTARPEAQILAVAAPVPGAVSWDGRGRAEPSRKTTPERADDAAGPILSLTSTSPAVVPHLRPAVSQAASIVMWQVSAAAPKPMEPPTAGTAIPVADEGVTPAPADGATDRTAVGAVSATAPAAAEAGLAPAVQPDGLALGPAAPATMGDGAPAPGTALPRPFHPLVAAIVAEAMPSAGPKPAQGTTELVLHPAELGRIRFALSGTGDQLTIAINAESRDTLALLQRHVPALQADLQREGLGQANLAFSGWGGEGAGDQGQSAAPPPDLWLEPALDQTAIPRPDARPAPLAGGGLDLRL